MKLYKLVACIIPRKKWRSEFRNFFKYYVNLPEVHKNYQNRIADLKQKSKIKVAFLVQENCKWSYDGIYQILKSEDRFEPVVCLINDSNPICDVEKNKSFFKNRGYVYQVINTPDEFRNFKPDIVFYEQSWIAIANGFNPKYVSQYALCLYVPYSVELDMEEHILKKTKNFYLGLYTTFVFNPAVQEIMKACKIHNTVSVGHPRLDAYASDKTPSFPWKSNNKMRIVYAPHHSFKKSILKMATYEWSGDFLYHLAKTHLDTTEWVFKPHPRFYTALKEEFGQQQADSIFEKWSEVSELYDEGDYFDLFKTADLMISDCCSFKVEWLPTLKPYINLVSNYPDAYVEGELKTYFSSGYYHAHNISELETYFHQLVELKKDPLKSQRETLVHNIPLNASVSVVNYIKNLIPFTNKRDK